MNQPTSRTLSQMRYYIGEHDGIEHPFDRSIYRAYFYWREGSNPRVQSFSVEQLKDHIASCKANRVPTHKFELALARLQRMNGSTDSLSLRASL